LEGARLTQQHKRYKREEKMGPYRKFRLKVPAPILTPLIVLFSAIGAYAVNNTTLDVWLLLVFGVVGYIFKKLDYPLASLVVAMVLGDITEEALRQSLILSDGSLLIFFTRPIAAFFMVMSLALFFLPALLPLLGRIRGRVVAQKA
jgi:putative tricarboxylic transport membrane protein